MTVLPNGGGWWDAHPVVLSLAFAAVMILNDRQDSQHVRKTSAWWFHLGLLLLAAFTVGALVNKFWLGAAIGLVAWLVDASLLRHRVRRAADGT